MKEHTISTATIPCRIVHNFIRSRVSRCSSILTQICHLEEMIITENKKEVGMLNLLCYCLAVRRSTQHGAVFGVECSWKCGTWKDELDSWTRQKSVRGSAKGLLPQN